LKSPGDGLDFLKLDNLNGIRDKPKMSTSKTQIVTIMKKWRMIIYPLFLFVCVIQLLTNLRQGYLLFPPFEVGPSPVLVTFRSQVKPFAIDYPKDWQAHDVLYGNHGDMEVIALISSPRFNAPILEIAYRELPDGTLEQVADWGKSRLESVSEADWNVSPPEAITIDNKPALIRTFRSERGLKPMCYQIYLLAQSDAYDVQMCMNEKNASPELEGLFKRMINSITF
jgi:hypothetical protein